MHHTIRAEGQGDSEVNVCIIAGCFDVYKQKRDIATTFATELVMYAIHNATSSVSVELAKALCGM
jgi:hypothetical protein